MKIRAGSAEITLEQGDLTAHAADAIVNAANSSLMGGGGVDGAIHRAGGPRILAECEQIVRRSGPLPAGRATVTTAGELPARFVVHTVGPIWRGGGDEEPATLAAAYLSSLDLAAANAARSVAFPSISTGAYGYPLAAAAGVAVAAVRGWLEAHEGALERITWVLFDTRTYGAYSQALAAISTRD